MAERKNNTNWTTLRLSLPLIIIIIIIQYLIQSIIPHPSKVLFPPVPRPHIPPVQSLNDLWIILLVRVQRCKQVHFVFVLLLPLTISTSPTASGHHSSSDEDDLHMKENQCQGTTTTTITTTSFCKEHWNWRFIHCPPESNFISVPIPSSLTSKYKALRRCCNYTHTFGLKN